MLLTWFRNLLALLALAHQHNEIWSVIFSGDKTTWPLTSESDWPSHSSSLVLLREPSESSSGVSMSSTFMSRSSGVSSKSSESSEPSLLSSDRLMSGAMSVRRFCRPESVWSAVRAARWAGQRSHKHSQNRLYKTHLHKKETLNLWKTLFNQKTAVNL